MSTNLELEHVKMNFLNDREPRRNQKEDGWNHKVALPFALILSAFHEPAVQLKRVAYSGCYRFELRVVGFLTALSLGIFVGITLRAAEISSIYWVGAALLSMAVGYFYVFPAIVWVGIDKIFGWPFWRKAEEKSLPLVGNVSFVTNIMAIPLYICIWLVLKDPAVAWLNIGDFAGHAVWLFVGFPIVLVGFDATIMFGFPVIAIASGIGVVYLMNGINATFVPVVPYACSLQVWVTNLVEFVLWSCVLFPLAIIALCGMFFGWSDKTST